MTYDELINSILEKCWHGEYEGWTVTDDSCAQMRKKLYTEYLFVDIIQAVDDPDCVCLRYAAINLDNYSDGELWYWGSMYYATQEEFFAQGVEIIAECVAENNMEVIFVGTADEVYEITKLIWGE